MYVLHESTSTFIGVVGVVTHTVLWVALELLVIYWKLANNYCYAQQKQIIFNKSKVKTEALLEQ